MDKNLSRTLHNAPLSLLSTIIIPSTAAEKRKLQNALPRLVLGVQWEWVTRLCLYTYNITGSQLKLQQIPNHANATAHKYGKLKPFFLILTFKKFFYFHISAESYVKKEITNGNLGRHVGTDSGAKIPIWLDVVSDVNEDALGIINGTEKMFGTHTYWQNANCTACIKLIDGFVPHRLNNWNDYNRAFRQEKEHERLIALFEGLQMLQKEILGKENS